MKIISLLILIQNKIIGWVSFVMVSISMPKKALSKASSGSMATTTKRSEFGMIALNM